MIMLQNMTTRTGFQLRDTLIRQSSLQFEDFKLVLQESSQKLLFNFWGIKQFPDISQSRMRQLVTDGLSGGQIGRSRVASLLKKINLDSSNKNGDLNQLSAEVISVLSPFASKLNYARMRTRCISAHLDNLSDNFGVNNLQSLPDIEKATFVKYSKTLLNANVMNLSSLQEWANSVHNLLLSVSNSFDILNDEKNSGISSRAKKGFIAGKNIPTYKKHWVSFIGEVFNDEFGAPMDNSESLANLIKDLEIIIEMDSKQMAQYAELQIKNNLSYEVDQNDNLNQGDNIDLEIPFDKRTLNVSFNKSGLDKSLIESLIKSLSIQISMQKTGKKPEPLRGKIRNGQSFIEVKLKDAQNKDLAQVKTILELL